MDFEALKLEHIGATADDGMTLKDEIEEGIENLAQLVTNELNNSKGKLTITISLHGQADKSVIVAAAMKVTQPGRKSRALMAFVDRKGSLVTQQAFQVTMPFAKPNAAERAANGTPPRETKPAGKSSEKRTEDSAP